MAATPTPTRPFDHNTVKKANDLLLVAERREAEAAAALAEGRGRLAEIEAAAASGLLLNKVRDDAKVADAAARVAALESGWRIAAAALELAQSGYSDALAAARVSYAETMRADAAALYRAWVRASDALAAATAAVNDLRSRALADPDAADALRDAPVIPGRFGGEGMADAKSIVESWLSPAHPTKAVPPDTTVVRFVQRPVWAFWSPFGKNYSAGDIAGLPAAEAARFIEAGVAEPLEAKND